MGCAGVKLLAEPPASTRKGREHQSSTNRGTIEEQSRNNRGTIESVPRAPGLQHAGRSVGSGSGRRPTSALWTDPLVTPRIHPPRMNPERRAALLEGQTG